MKIIIISLFSLLVGAGFGWYFGYTMPIAKANRDARQEMLSIQADDSMAAIIAIRAVPLIESGDTQKAVQWLSKPIGSYYRVYALHAGTNEERLNLRGQIEEMASTNSVIAAEIHRKVE
jgi:hypothetical protein